MNRSLLVMSACILLLAGVCVLAAQEEKKSPPPPTNQPATPKSTVPPAFETIGKQPPPPTNQPGPPKPVTVTVVGGSRPGVKCVGVSVAVTGPEARPTTTLLRTWEDGVVEVSALSGATGVATKWRRYDEMIK